MTKTDLKTRKDKVLEYIVTVYTELGIPVGSVTLRNFSKLDLSPATIRNIMKDLETEGLITHPHTSAGRLPTETGYRYYLDNIMKPDALVEDDKNRIISVCESSINEPEGLLEEMSRLLSDISNEVSMVLLPKARLVSFGWYHLFLQPEFRNISGPIRLLKAFEEKKEVLDFVEESVNSRQVKVFVGRENKCRDMSDCSIVISGYGTCDGITGAIGLIGPTRMCYKRAVPMVDYIAREIDDFLNEEY